MIQTTAAGFLDVGKHETPANQRAQTASSRKRKQTFVKHSFYLTNRPRLA